MNEVLESILKIEINAFGTNSVILEARQISIEILTHDPIS